MGFKAVVFDLDGTLVDSSEAIAEATAMALDSLGLPKKSRGELLGFVKLRPSDYIRVVLPRDGCDNGLLKRFADEFRRAYRRVHLRLVKPVDGAMQALEALERMGLSIGVVTGRTLLADYAEEELKGLGLSKYIDSLTTYEVLPRARCKADLILECLRTLGIDGKECVVVGDSPEDIQAGKGIGAITVAALYGFHTRDELMKFKPDYIIQRISEVVNYICAHPEEL